MEDKLDLDDANASHYAGAVGSPAAPCRAVGSPNAFARHNEA